MTNMPTKDALIKAMAEALIKVDYPKGDYYRETMMDDHKIYKKQAEAALDAMLAMLPEIERLRSGCTGRVLRTNATKLYENLLDMRGKKDV